MQAVVDKRPYVSARSPEVQEQFFCESIEKAKEGQCRLVRRDANKDNPPQQLKISPIAATPHKSRKWRAILELSLSLRLDDGSYIPCVNDKTTKTAPRGAFPSSLQEAGDPMAFKKMERKDCLYDTRKDILGFDFDDVKHTLWLKDAKREA